MPRRVLPTAVTVIAIFHFIVGGLGLLLGLFGLIFLLVSGGDVSGFGFTPQMKEELATVQRLLNERAPFYRVYQAEGLVVGLVLSTLLVVAGVGLLRLRPWARTLSLVYAPLSILQTLFAALYTLAYINPVQAEINLENFRRMSQANPQAAQAAEQAMRITTVSTQAATVLGILLAMVYPVAVLIVMLLPSVRAAFRGRPLAAEPEDYRDPVEGADGSEPDDRFRAGGR